MPRCVSLHGLPSTRAGPRRGFGPVRRWRLRGPQSIGWRMSLPRSANIRQAQDDWVMPPRLARSKPALARETNAAEPREDARHLSSGPLEAPPMAEPRLQRASDGRTGMTEPQLRDCRSSDLGRPPPSFRKERVRKAFDAQGGNGPLRSANAVCACLTMRRSSARRAR